MQAICAICISQRDWSWWENANCHFNSDFHSIIMSNQNDHEKYEGKWSDPKRRIKNTNLVIQDKESFHIAMA